MPVAIYALSYKYTGSILSYCRLEQQSLGTPADIAALHDRLVGDSFVISFATPTSPAGAFKIPSDDIAVDEVQANDATLAKLVQNPYAYVLKLPDDDSLKPGDGKPKPIVTPHQLTITMTAAVSLPATPQVFSAGISSQPNVKTPVYAFFEGRDPVSTTIEVAFTSAAFDNVLTFTSGTKYAMVTLGRGLETSLRIRTAT